MRIRWIFVALLAVWLGGCARPDPTIILGRWKAEGYPLDGLKIPLAPNIEVTRNDLLLLNPDGAPFQAFQLSAIRAEGREIDLEMSGLGGITLTFQVENPERIHFRVPIIGSDIAFNKLK